VLGVSAPLAVCFIFYMGKPVEWVWYSMMLSTVVAFVIAVSWLISTVSKLPKSKTA
jgi:Na+-driven multidrug efflux pump